MVESPIKDPGYGIIYLAADSESEHSHPVRIGNTVLISPLDASKARGRASELVEEGEMKHLGNESLVGEKVRGEMYGFGRNGGATFWFRDKDTPSEILVYSNRKVRDIVYDRSKKRAEKLAQRLSLNTPGERKYGEEVRRERYSPPFKKIGERLPD